jgi:hypothetical protein
VLAARAWEKLVETESNEPRSDETPLAVKKS